MSEEGEEPSMVYVDGEGVKWAVPYSMRRLVSIVDWNNKLLLSVIVCLLVLIVVGLLIVLRTGIVGTYLSRAVC